MRLAPIVVEHVAGVRHERRVDERGRVVAERQTSPTLYPSEIQLGNTNLISKTLVALSLAIPAAASPISGTLTAR